MAYRLLVLVLVGPPSLLVLILGLVASVPTGGWKWVLASWRATATNLLILPAHEAAHVEYETAFTRSEYRTLPCVGTSVTAPVGRAAGIVTAVRECESAPALSEIQIQWDRPLTSTCHVCGQTFAQPHEWVAARDTLTHTKQGTWTLDRIPTGPAPTIL